MHIVGGDIFLALTNTLVFVHFSGIDKRGRGEFSGIFHEREAVEEVEQAYNGRIVSVFGSANLGWRHMLYLDATVRGDKSSTLASGKNLYVYPSVSGSWVFSELI